MSQRGNIASKHDFEAAFISLPCLRSTTVVCESSTDNNRYRGIALTLSVSLTLYPDGNASTNNEATVPARSSSPTDAQGRVRVSRAPPGTRTVVHEEHGEDDFVLTCHCRRNARPRTCPEEPGECENWRGRFHINAPLSRKRRTIGTLWNKRWLVCGSGAVTRKACDRRKHGAGSE